MSLRARVLEGAALLSVGQGVSQALSFVRNIIVARLISPEDFGIAATFALTVSLLDMISNLAADMLIIQARDGDDEGLQATAQLWQFTRGVVSALLIASVAWPMSRLFKVPQAQWAFYWLALVPLLRGCVHLDIKRLQRGMKFGPQVMTELGSQALIAAAAFPLVYWLRDYSAMLWLVIIQAAALVALSHVLAERRYRWGYDREQARRLLSFGWPLLINGLLMFAIMQGDRLMIGAGYSMFDLGVYSAALALAMAPASLLGGTVASVMLPLLSTVQDDKFLFRKRYALCVDALGLIAGLLAIAFVCLAPLLLSALFGVNYQSGWICLALLGLAQSARLLRVGPTGAALAVGDTKNSMWANVWRLSGVAASAALVLGHASLYWIPVAALAGELLGLAYVLVRLRRRYDLAPWTCLRPASGAGLFATIPLVLMVCNWSPHGWSGALALTIGCAAAHTAFAATTSASLRANVRVAWTHLWRNVPRAAIS